MSGSMTLADRLRANASLLQMLHQAGRGVPRKLLPGLVADMLRDAVEADGFAEAEAFMSMQVATKPRRRAA